VGTVGTGDPYFGQARLRPGEVAVLTGTGFQANEDVYLTVRIFDPATNTTINNYDWTFQYADAGGSFVTYFTIPSEAIGMTLTVTALGLESGRTASVTFTDNANTRITLLQPSSGTVGSEIQASAKLEYDNGVIWQPLTNRTITFTLRSGPGNGSILATKSGSTNSQGNVSVNIAVPTGADRLRADFNGVQGTYKASESSIDFTAISAKAGTSTSVSSSANASVFGQSVSFTATVSSSAGTPGGSVQFKIGGVDHGTPVTLVNGSATSTTISSLSVGNHTVTAVYAETANYQGSTGTLANGQTVNRRTLPRRCPPRTTRHSTRSP
jgi:hypothetical protein